MNIWLCSICILQGGSNNLLWVPPKNSVQSMVLRVLSSGLRPLTSVTVTSSTLWLPSRSTRKVWTGLSRTALPSLPSMTAWSGLLNWWGQTLLLLLATHQHFIFPLLLRHAFVLGRWCSESIYILNMYLTFPVFSVPCRPVVLRRRMSLLNVRLWS